MISERISDYIPPQSKLSQIFDVIQSKVIDVIQSKAIALCCIISFYSLFCYMFMHCGRSRFVPTLSIQDGDILTLGHAYRHLGDSW